MEKELTKTGIIYKITSPNNKIYIGQSINFKQRCRKYKCNAFEGQIKLWNNCQKYDWNPIDNIEIIEVCLYSELDEREQYWITEYDSYNNGLNADLGGKTRKGFKHSDETKEKLRLINLGNKHTDETKKKISEYCKNRPIEINEKISKSNIGKKLTEETKIKIGESNTGRKLTDEQKLKISVANIGNKKMLGKNHDDETKQKIRESKAKTGYENVKRCKVICLDTNEIFDSILEASNKLNANKSKISDVCRKKRKKTNGLVFMYYEEYLKKLENEEKDSSI